MVVRRVLIWVWRVCLVWVVRLDVQWTGLSFFLPAPRVCAQLGGGYVGLDPYRVYNFTGILVFSTADQSYPRAGWVTFGARLFGVARAHSREVTPAPVPLRCVLSFGAVLFCDATTPPLIG